MFVRTAGVLGLLVAYVVGAGIESGRAQSWAWAVYHDGKGTIYVARMTSVDPRAGWEPLAPYTNQTNRQAKEAACLLSTVGDLTNRKYYAPQIASGEWSC